MLLTIYFLASPMIGTMLAHKLSGGSDSMTILAFVGVPLINACLYL